MKTFRCCALLLAVLLFHALPALAGPFGTNMGDGLDKFPVAERIAEFTYLTKNVPEPHPQFTRYVLSIHPLTGLYAVTGYAEFHAGDTEGAKVKENFARLLKTFVGLHGEGFYLNAPGWDKKDSSFIPMLYNGNISHKYLWGRGRGKLDDSVKDAVLFIFAYQADSACIAIRYQYKNMEELLIRGAMSRQAP